MGVTNHFSAGIDAAPQEGIHIWYYSWSKVTAGRHQALLELNVHDVPGGTSRLAVKQYNISVAGFLFLFCACLRQAFIESRLA